MARKNDKNIREIIGADDFVGEFFKSIALEVANQGGTTADLRKVVGDGALRAKLADLIVGEQALAPKPFEPEPVITECDLVVDYGKTIEEMLKAGEYNGYVNPNVTTRNYPVAGAGVVQRKAQLVHFGKNMSDAAVDAWCEEHGKRRATALEVLACGAAYKLLQLEYPIVSGQAARLDGVRRVVYLYGDDRKRSVGLCWAGSDWGGHCRFLVFDKERT